MSVKVNGFKSSDLFQLIKNGVENGPDRKANAKKV